MHINFLNLNLFISSYISTTNLTQYDNTVIVLVINVSRGNIVHSSVFKNTNIDSGIASNIASKVSYASIYLFVSDSNKN